MVRMISGSLNEFIKILNADYILHFVTGFWLSITDKWDIIELSLIRQSVMFDRIAGSWQKVTAYRMYWESVFTSITRR